MDFGVILRLELSTIIIFFIKFNFVFFYQRDFSKVSGFIREQFLECFPGSFFGRGFLGTLFRIVSFLVSLNIFMYLFFAGSKAKRANLKTVVTRK